MEIQLHLLTRREAAKRMRVCQKTLDDAVRYGEIGYVRLGTRRGKVMFRETDLLAYVNHRATAPNPAAL